MIELSLFLYWKPCPDMEIEGEKNFDPEILRKQAKFLKGHLEETAEILEKLKKAGWDYSGGLYDIMCYKDISKEEAEKELKELEIDIGPDQLMEWEEEH